MDSRLPTKSVLAEATGSLNKQSSVPASKRSMLKPESRTTLASRSNSTALSKSVSLVRSKSSTSLAANRTKAVVARPPSATGSRPASVNGNRSVSGADQSSGPESVQTKKVRRAAWDTKGRLEDMEDAYRELRDHMKDAKSHAVTERDSIEAELQEQKKKSDETEFVNNNLRVQIDCLNLQIGSIRGEAHLAKMAEEQLIHRHGIALENAQNDVCKTEQRFQQQLSEKTCEITTLRRSHEEEIRILETQLVTKTRDIAAHEDRAEDLGNELRREKKTITSLRDQLTDQSSDTANLQANNRTLCAKIELLELSVTEAEKTICDLRDSLVQSELDKESIKCKLISEETQRRILHNQIQELKGNIRVFCRVRPSLTHESNESCPLQLSADAEEIEVLGAGIEMSLSGKEEKTYSFQFDKVFGPSSQNDHVFEEISQLIQSALDGYNVSIFAYGQTGSGKTHTMSSSDGMIPKAVSQIYAVAQSLESRGWKYTIDGSFLEIYCESMRDLLSLKQSPTKLEIRHDDKRKSTLVEGLTSVRLDEISKVAGMLDLAGQNRTIAATAANERSSRSHSVFILTLEGKNEGTGERSRGVLNLIDLAGSERLSQSHAAGDRLKETQAINKSLSCLADVIYALGNDSSHIPYRNSKLTYLLQHSLGGNSKTLMFVNVSPLREHTGETLCSLRFATKVNNTHIGTARAQKGTRS